LEKIPELVVDRKTWKALTALSNGRPVLILALEDVRSKVRR